MSQTAMLYIQTYCWLSTKISCILSKHMLHTKMCNVQAHVTHECEMYSVRTYVTYRNVLCPNICSHENPLGYILSTSVCMQNFIITFYSVQEIGPFSLFQNLELGKASTYDKCHLAISLARSCQYQYVCKSLSKYPKRFESCRHFSRTVRGFTN